MVEDIHNLKGVLAKSTERYLSRLHPDDQEDVRRFTDDLLAQGYTAGRAVKYLYLNSFILPPYISKNRHQ